MAKLYFKFGAMGCSKTAQALITKFNYEERGMKVLLLKPSVDVRDGEEIVKSRIGLTAKAVVVNDKEERLAIEELSKENGLVIATGGGAVLDENNVRALRRNGVILFLDRSLENLVATLDRPLSSDTEKLKNLFEKRYDVYKSCADAVIPADGKIADVVEKIKGVLL